MMDLFRSISASETQKRFQDRVLAGRALAGRLLHYQNDPNVIVLALPRGGVPVGYEVARKLGAPLDVMLVRKIGAPVQPELAIGAIASGGVLVLDRDKMKELGITQQEIDAVIITETQELHRREKLFRGDKPQPNVDGKTVILVDDGLATGSTMRAAAQALALLGPSRIIVAVPVAAAETCDDLETLVDEVVCVMTPERFYAVGLWYRNFEQTTDEEVRHLLSSANAEFLSEQALAPAR